MARRHRPRIAAAARGARAGKVAAGLGAAAVGLASCGVASSLHKGQQVRSPDLIYAFNKGNNTVSVIDSASGAVKVVQNVPLNAYGLYPSNQYGLSSGYLLLPEPTKVVVLKDSNLKPVATIPMTASKGVWAAMTPNGKTGIVVGRSNDQINWINLNPSSREFGVVTKSVTIPGKAGLCDISLSPHGRYAYIPDLYSNQIQVVDTSTGQTVYRASVPGLSKPFMGTVSWNGKIWAVESSAGQGSVWYFSLANPTHPTLLKSVSATSGLGLGPHTDEFSPNGKYDFVLDRKSSQVSVVSTSNFKVVKNINLPKGGKPRVGAFSYHGHTLFVSLEGVNSVAAVNTSTLALSKIIKVGPTPVGIAPSNYAWLNGA